MLAFVINSTPPAAPIAVDVVIMVVVPEPVPINLNVFDVSIKVIISFVDTIDELTYKPESPCPYTVETFALIDAYVPEAVVFPFASTANNPAGLLLLSSRINPPPTKSDDDVLRLPDTWRLLAMLEETLENKPP